MEDNEVDFIINEFLRNLCLVESEVVSGKSKRIRHVHWWDGWENKPEAELEDFKALKYELYAILERTGAHKKDVMEELRKRTRKDKTGESVRCMVLAYYKMAAHISGSNLNDTNNLASRVHRMLQLEYFEEHGKFPVVKDERENEKLAMEEDEMADQKSVEEDSRCLATEDVRSAGILELKEAKESQELKVAHDPEAFGMVGNKNSDDLLLQIVAVEAEWNALTTVFSVKGVQEGKGAEDFAEETIKIKDNVNIMVVAPERRGMFIDMYEQHLIIGLYDVIWRVNEIGAWKVFWDRGMNFESLENSISNNRLISKFVFEFILDEDIFDSDLIWRRLIRSVVEQSLANLRSSQGLIIF